VVAAANCDAFAIEVVADLLGAESIHHERQDAGQAES
jgi:hypothetical protein